MIQPASLKLTVI